jgi:pre-mRNA cleavage complex 2 protein Pcf11
VDELDKVSLERLADINPNLLQQIKDAAIEEQKQQHLQQQSSSSSTVSGGGIKSSFVSTIPPTSSSSSDWSKLNLNHLEKSSSLIASLQRHVRSANGITIVSSQVNDTVHLYASVSASAQILTTMLQQFKDGTSNLLHMDDGEDDYGDNNKQSSKRKRRYSIVKKENFTNDGVRKRNDAVIAQLYEVGLPFICSTDGRRFASQLELSKHLDTLFRISQVEKYIERTGGGGIGGGSSSNERGWYMHEDDWSLVGSKTMDDAIMTMGNNTDKTSSSLLPGTMSTMNDDGITRSKTVIADESRDRCSLCGINFAMFFDQDDGEWKYRNCMESNVENDGPTMEEEDCDPVLVHVTCWEGLGCPTVLGLDEIRHSK